MTFYKLEDKFMIREPVYDLKKYNSIFSKNEDVDQNLMGLLKDNQFKEILFVNNKKLYYQLMKITELNPDGKRYRHLINSLSNYFNRICTRATPYGLDAMVSLGKFSKNEKNCDNKLFKHIYPDMEWLSKVIRKIEIDLEDLNYLYVKWNNVVVCNKTYFKLLFVKDDERKNLQRKLKITSITKAINKFTQNNISVKKLISNLQYSLHIDDKTSILRVIKMLVVNDFLLTNISLSNVNKDNFNTLVKNIKNIPKERSNYELLVDIRKKMRLYHKTELGNGIEILKEIVLKMSMIQKSVNYIHVDFQKEDQVLSIKEKPKNLSNLVTFLKKVTPDYKKSDYLENYTKAFLDKYGPYTEVPLLVLLDPDKGLGSPYSKIFSISDTSNTKQSILLKEAIIKSIVSKNKYCDVENCDLPDLSDQEHINNFPTSLELYVKTIFCADNSALNTMIIPNSGSDKSGKTFGRFTYMFNRSNPISHMPEEIEVVDTPKNKRVLNVMLTNTNNSVVNVGTTGPDKNSIDIKDILVGVERDGESYYFYFKSRVTKKRLFFSATSMINYKNGEYLSYIASFLIEASHNKESNPFYIIRLLENFDNFPRIPAFYYKNIILTPLRWNFNKYTLGNFASKSELTAKFDAFMERWEVPKLVFLERNDNRLLLNLNLKIHRNELIREILSKTNVSIYEPILKNSNKLAEYVYSLTDNNLKNTTSVPLITRELDVAFNSRERKFILGDDWLYLKVYCSRNDLNTLITYKLSSLYKKMHDEKYIKLFHYLVFRDPDYHIRIRFKLYSKTKLSKVMEHINTWIHNLLEENLISRVTFDTYDREIERYGGLQFIKHVEQIFDLDSIDAMNYFAETMQSKLNKVESIEQFALKLGFSIGMQKDLLIDRFHYSPKLKDIYAKNKKYVQAYKLDFISFVEQNEYNFNKLPLYADKNHHLSKYDVELFFSLIHMHCNRIGIKHGNNEIEIMLLWLKLIKEADYYLGDGKNK
ncbi:MAG: lantibiotic dehydratase [Lactobacillus crispatus]|nr:lantibiotic dehydratase [Lactobacillus crispatus]